MEDRILGTTGASVSPLCLGAMMFGDPADREESHRILDAARDAGPRALRRRICRPRSSTAPKSSTSG